MMINLHEYIIEGDFLTDLANTKGNYTIVSDINFENNYDTITTYSFEDLFARGDSILSENIICISQRLVAQDMILINTLIGDTLPHRISLSPGLMSLRNKNMPEENDITTMIGYGYQVREPYQSTQIIKSISEDQPSYHRIHDTYIPETLSKKAKNSSIVSIAGHKSGNLTVLSGVSCIDTVASALHAVSNGSLDMFDLYAWSHINSTLDPELQESIIKSKRLLVVFDHKATEELRVFINTLLYNHCDSDIQIHYLLPQYHLVQSILSDYINEEAAFDEQAIIDFVQSILDTINRES